MVKIWAPLCNLEQYMLTRRDDVTMVTLILPSKRYLRFFRRHYLRFPSLAWGQLLRQGPLISKPRIHVSPWRSLWTWCMCQSQLQSQQPMAAVPPPRTEATAPKTREAPSTLSYSAAVPHSGDSRRKSRNRRKRHRGRRSWKSRSPYDFESSSESSSTSVSDLRSMIGVRDPLRLEVRDGSRRVSVESRGQKRSHSEQGSGRKDQQRSRSPAHRSTTSCRSHRRGKGRRRGSSMEDGSGNDSDTISPSRYSVFRNAVRTSKDAYTSENPKG